MRKFLGVASALGLAMLPAVSLAATFVVRDEYASVPQDVVSSNLYIVSGNVSVGATVKGDLTVAGNTIVVVGPVSGDVAAAGATVQLLGSVGGDVRALSGSVSINNRVHGDVDALTGTIRLLPGSSVDGDLSVVGGDVIVDGLVKGDVRVKGGRLTVNGVVTGSVDARLSETLTLGPGARIGGKLTYRAPHEAVIGSGAKVGGQVMYEPVASKGDRGFKGALWAVFGAVIAMKTLAYLGFAGLIVWRWRRSAVDVLQEARDAILPSLGRGFAYSVLIPLAGILLLVSFVGTIAGALLMAAYGATMAIASVLAGMFLGAGLEMVMRKTTALHITWGNALGGVILLSIIGLVPVVGWLVMVALTMLMFGVLAHRGVHVLMR